MEYQVDIKATMTFTVHTKSGGTMAICVPIEGDDTVSAARDFAAVKAAWDGFASAMHEAGAEVDFTPPGGEDRGPGRLGRPPGAKNRPKAGD